MDPSKSDPILLVGICKDRTPRLCKKDNMVENSLIYGDLKGLHKCRCQEGTAIDKIDYDQEETF